MMLKLGKRSKKKTLKSLLALSLLGSGLLWVNQPVFIAAQAQDDGAAESPAAQIETLRQAVEQSRQNSKDPKKQGELADSLYQLGKALAEQRNFVEAQTNLEAALALDLQLNKAKSLVNDYMALALVQTYQKQYDKAGALYNKGLELARAKDMAAMVVAINNSLGSNAIYAGQYDQAKQFFNQAKAAAKTANDFVGEAQASLNLALILEHDGNLKEAISETEIAAKLLAGENGDPEVAASAALNLGKLKDRAGDLDGALKQFEAVANAGADLAGEADAWLSIGNIKLSRGQGKEADQAFSKALEIYKANDNKPYISLLLIRLGCAKADMGDFSAAEKLHVQAIQAARQNKDNNNLYHAQSELAYDFYLEGNSEKALGDFSDLKRQLASGLTISDASAPADLTTSIALCYRALGQPTVARDYYTQAMNLYAKINNQLAQVKSLNSIAVTYLDSDNLKEFKARHDQVLAALDKLGDRDKQSRDYKHFVGDVAYNYAQSQVMVAQDEAALVSYKEALTAYTECGDPRGQMSARRGIGLAQLQTGRATKNTALINEALTNFLAAKTIAVQLGSTEGQWDTAIGAGSCYRALGDASAAEANLKTAIQLFEKEKGHFTRDDSKTFALDLRFQAFEELVALQFEQKRYADALATAERGRARAFLDLLEGRKRNLFSDNKLAVLTGDPSVHGAADSQTVKPKAAAEIASSKVKPDALVASADLPSAGPNNSSADPYATVTRGVSVVPRNPNQADLETALSPINADAPTLAQIKTLVASHKTDVVEYFVTANGLFIFVAHPDGSVDAVCQPCGRSELAKLVEKTYGAIVDPPVNFADLKASNLRRDKNLADLYTTLIAPIKAFLPKDAEALVTIVPHRTLFLVPFAALISENKKFLVEDHTLAVVPAIGVLRATEHMAAERAGEKNKLLAFGNPAIKNVPGLGPLPYAEQEVKKIATLFGTDQVMVKTGSEATKATLNNLAQNYNVIHLATHGLIDEEHPMDSAVLLATTSGDDGVLSVRDILKLPQLKANLVTLSACQTGRGKISGDGVAGLSRSFIIAGTPSVLVSLWNVDDVMTAFQMESFYKDYLTSANKASALRAAQIKTINFMEKGLTAAGERANPRYWAAFQLVGEGGR